MKLRAIECYAGDSGKGVARIDTQSMNVIGSLPGEVIELMAQRSAVAKCMLLHDNDEGKGIIRIDSFLRESAGVGMNEDVIINKVKSVPTAEKIVVLPLGPLPPLEPNYVPDCLENIPVSKGAIIAVPYFGGRLTFQVVNVEPDSSVAVLVKETTECEIQRAKYF